jgi:hypothetical protein
MPLGIVVVALSATPSAAVAVPSRTTATVSRQVTVAAPRKSPVNVVGMPQVARGLPLPRGYVLVGRSATVVRGRLTTVAPNAFALTCPRGRTIAGVGTRGAVSFLPTSSTAPFGRRRARFHAAVSPGVKPGQKRRGAIYAVCFRSG